MLSLPAGPRRLPRCALLAAAFLAAIAAFALPSAAQADTIATVKSDNRLGYFQTDPLLNEANDITLRQVGNEIVISDVVRVTAGNGCQVFNQREAVCPANVAGVDVSAFRGNDRVEYRLPHAGGVELGEGNDILFAGTRDAGGRAIEPVSYFGDHLFPGNTTPGSDTISYSKAGEGVSLTPEDGLANDGRPADRENVGPDFESVFGSDFDDSRLFGTAGRNSMMGLRGRDAIAGGGGDDLFVASPADGADDYHGGPGRDTITYEGRNQPLLVTLDNVDKDGERDERDNVRSNVENVIGGSAGDVLESLGAFSRLDGRGGDDFLFGDAGPDTLIGGPGVDNLNAGDGNDIVDSRDGQLDTIDCGDAIGSDTVVKDGQERRVDDCEGIELGTLRLVPKQARTEVDETAWMRLSWRHPRAWRKLRTIELRFTRDEMPVGEITLRPRGARVTDDGAVTLVRRDTRLTRRGKTVAARLALRLDQSLAGQTLEADVEATDQRGRRQLERDAGRIRVSD